MERTRRAMRCLLSFFLPRPSKNLSRARGETVKASAALFVAERNQEREESAGGARAPFAVFETAAIGSCDAKTV